ncbi:MAG TPA: flagellar basal body P-ring formation chaperone FlgA [Ferrovibrio sp.]|uniref:flagellar basal body P-ring formation chaperone FlgA n=1 Tax=Ferrovibrio sp. TaxID=1917215 RepID=UPI002ED67E5B
MAKLHTLFLLGLAAAALAPSVAYTAPAAAQTQVAAVSGGQVIGEREIAKRLTELVEQRNGGQSVEISFHGLGNEIEVPPATPAVLQVESFSYDARSGRFLAALTTPGRTEPVTVSGRAQPVELIPVLKNRVMPGDTISRNDVEWQRVPAGRYGAGYIDQINELIGQSPRRPLATGMPIRAADIGRPEAVGKNVIVTMVAQGPGITITTTGRALEAGSIGDVIPVMNLQSRKTIQATITGTNEVQVTPAPRVIASN